MPVISSGYAIAAAVLAALAIAVAVFFTRKRLAWETCFDMPVGLTTLGQVSLGPSGRPPRCRMSRRSR